MGRHRLNKDFDLLIERLASDAKLSVSTFTRLKVRQCLGIERTLGPKKWARLLIRVENDRLKRYYKNLPHKQIV